MPKKKRRKTSKEEIKTDGQMQQEVEVQRAEKSRSQTVLDSVKVQSSSMRWSIHSAHLN